MSGVLVLGALHHDVVVDAPRLPRPDETLQGTAVDYRFGGKGGNQAVMAARMGARVAMAGRVGRDAAGAEILAALDDAGVNRTGVRFAGAPTGMSVAITDPNGEYGAVIVSGANLENDGRVNLADPPEIALLQNEIPEAANLALARRLPRDATLILNAAPARPTAPALLARTDILIVNRVEAADLTGAAAPEAAAEALRATGPAIVLVTLGAEGLLIADAAGHRRLPADPVPVVSTHGAGDAFTGAFAAELSRGRAADAAARFARAAAALLVASPIPDRAALTEAAVRARLAQTPSA